ncbi:MAG: 50S ribosomal protein L11 methyltransferase [Chromatiaceae bacterium]|nr:50S ribosomal protein L11 methyltransferase [Chromatiaceae bacterium]MCP5408656.1 50S ribosomal protein L11 methyltransferase [Chromatiaceae bacterium]MCP5442619.1 50S ribosomal protein L11 methyltransferase [Chromatiaceae bacterium]
MPWIQLHLTVEKRQAPLIERLLEKLGALSVTLGDAADEPLLEPAPGESPLWQKTRISGLFAEETDPDRLRNRIYEAVDHRIGQSLEWERLEDKQWERVWLENFKPMKFGRRLWICPDGQRPQDGNGIYIDLDPGLAFGTGTHPTTALCLGWLDTQQLMGARIVDYGCGSGILSIAALKLGAREVIAIDHDPQALDATRANGEKNGVLERLRIYHSESAPDIGKVELVLANILAGTLIDLEPVLAGLILPNGRIILSGLLGEQVEAVSAVYAVDFDLLEPTCLENWVLLEGNLR